MKSKSNTVDGKDLTVTQLPADKGGAPSKLSDEKTAKLVEYLEAGNYLETASALVGIRRQTVHNWSREAARILDSGKPPKNEHEKCLLRFLDAIEKAMATGEAKDLARVGAHADKQWQAAAWRLERRYPDRYGQRNATTNVRHGGAIEFIVKHIYMDQQPAPALDITPDSDGD